MCWCKLPGSPSCHGIASMFGMGVDLEVATVPACLLRISPHINICPVNLFHNHVHEPPPRTPYSLRNLLLTTHAGSAPTSATIVVVVLQGVSLKTPVGATSPFSLAVSTDQARKLSLHRRGRQALDRSTKTLQRLLIGIRVPGLIPLNWSPCSRPDPLHIEAVNLIGTILGHHWGGGCVKDNEEIEVKHESLDRPELLQDPCHQTTSIEDRNLSTWFGKLWLSLYCYFD
jgi:hypothetical protein